MMAESGGGLGAVVDCRERITPAGDDAAGAIGRHQVAVAGIEIRAVDESRAQDTWLFEPVPGVDGDVLAAPLGPSQEPSGVLVLIARPRTAFTSADGALVEALREPFSAALENDRRLREMASMRAAAEADKESLLSR